MSSSYRVHTGSRLHFGLWGWGAQHDHQFGGVGMMVDQPELVVQLSPAKSFAACGPAAERVAQVVRRCAQAWQLQHPPLYRIEVLHLSPPQIGAQQPMSPRQHVGLGTGTQLDLAVARGVAQVTGRVNPAIEMLAQAARRGRRSAIGSHGFAQGGLLVDAGKQPEQSLGRLQQRVDVPAKWRVVLAIPRQQTGLAGAAERQAFSRLPPVPVETMQRLRHLATEELLPSAQQADFDRFTDAVYEYGYQAGLCFATWQQGAFSSPNTAQLVAMLRGQGVRGVGQSSWGPTVFAFAPDSHAAGEIARWLTPQPACRDYDLLVVRPRNKGAQLSKQASFRDCSAAAVGPSTTDHTG